MDCVDLKILPTSWSARHGIDILMTQEFLRQYIAGDWQPSASNETIEITDPATGAPVARVVCGDERDALAAASAAGGAWIGWSTTPLERRVEFVQRFGAALARGKDALAQTIAAEVGTPLKIAQIVQVDSPIRNVEHFIEAARTLDWERQIGNSQVLREPVGVVACITPWNFPLHQIVLKIVPALLGGNTVVVKPSEMVPRTNELICAALHEAGFPAGVVNVVTGTGPVVGACLATTGLVDMVSFTGSTEAGIAVTAMAAATVKKVTTELGGKSPSLVLPGADLARAVKGTLGSCMLNNGQTCSALTRLLVPAQQRADVEALLRQEMAKLTVGPALSEGTRVGPLVSPRQSERAQALIDDGIAQGAVAINEAAPVPAHGNYVSPQAFWVERDNPLARAEVFGPVLTVLTYDSVDDGIALANDSVYGLAAAVWGETKQALQAARQIRAGQVDINGARFNPLAPFGGFKQSGVGREAGAIGLEEFLEFKAIQT